MHLLSTCCDYFLSSVETIFIFSSLRLQNAVDLPRIFLCSAKWSLITRTMMRTVATPWGTDTPAAPWVAQWVWAAWGAMARVLSLPSTRNPVLLVFDIRICQMKIQSQVVKNRKYLQNKNNIFLILLDEGEEEEITCYCKKPYGGRPMIECSSCQTWVHLTCAKVKRTAIPDVWFCSLCKTKSTKLGSGAKSRARKVLNSSRRKSKPSSTSLSSISTSSSSSATTGTLFRSSSKRKL